MPGGKPAIHFPFMTVGVHCGHKVDFTLLLLTIKPRVSFKTNGWLSFPLWQAGSLGLFAGTMEVGSGAQRLLWAH